MIAKLIFPVLTTGFFVVLVSLTFLANIIQLLCAPFSFIFPGAVYCINGYLAGGLWRLCDFYFKAICGAKVDLHCAKEIKRGRNAMLISNHKFFGDFFLLHTFAIDQGMLEYCKYFAKDSLKFVPFFGWGIYLMGCIMVKRDWARDKENIQKTFRMYLGQSLPVWIVSYVEGTRFTPSKAAQSRSYAIANGIKPLMHLLLPRTKGFVSALESFRSGSRIKTVYNAVLVYYHPKRGFGATPTVSDFLFGRVSEFTYQVHVTMHHIDDIPLDSKAAANWLTDLYSKNDKLLNDLESSLSK